MKFEEPSPMVFKKGIKGDIEEVIKKQESTSEAVISEARKNAEALFAKKETVELEGAEPTKTNTEIEEKRINNTIIRRKAA